MQTVRKEKNSADKICAVCDDAIISPSPIDDLCKSCFEKEVILFRLTDYLQNADAKKLNIIQSCSVQNVSLMKDRMPEVFTQEKTEKKACVERISTGVRYELAGLVTVFGRSAEKADCVIQNNAMSGNHAAIIKENNTFYIKDNNSSNGTWLNGRKLDPDTKYALCNNDRVRFANENMVFIIK